MLTNFHPIGLSTYAYGTHFLLANGRTVRLTGKIWGMVGPDRGDLMNLIMGDGATAALFDSRGRFVNGPPELNSPIVGWIPCAASS